MRSAYWLLKAAGRSSAHHPQRKAFHHLLIMKILHRSRTLIGSSSDLLSVALDAFHAHYLSPPRPRNEVVPTLPCSPYEGSIGGKLPFRHLSILNHHLVLFSLPFPTLLSSFFQLTSRPSVAIVRCRKHRFLAEQKGRVKQPVLSCLCLARSSIGRRKRKATNAWRQTAAACPVCRRNCWDCQKWCTCSESTGGKQKAWVSQRSTSCSCTFEVHFTILQSNKFTCSQNY